LFARCFYCCFSSQKNNIWSFNEHEYNYLIKHRVFEANVSKTPPQPSSLDSSSHPNIGKYLTRVENDDSKFRILVPILERLFLETGVLSKYDTSFLI